MRKIITLLAVILMFTYSYADNTTQVGENSFITEKGKENWFFTFGAGGNVYLGQNDSEIKFQNRIGYGASIHFGKWFTPAVGFRLGVDGGEYRGGVPTWSNGAFVVPNSAWGKEDTRHNTPSLLKQQFVAFNPRLDIMFSLFNSFGKTKPDRVFDMILHAGGGVFVNSRYNVDKSTTANGGYYTLSPTANIGLINKFRVSDGWDINIEIDGGWVINTFDGEVISQDEYTRGDIITSARLSATYKFKPRGTKMYADIATKHQAELDSLNSRCNIIKEQAISASLKSDEAKARIKELSAANALLTDSINTLNNNQVVNIKSRTKLTEIEFKIGSSEISNAALKKLKSAARTMEMNPNIKYEVCGYADNATGSTERNIRLRNARANRTINILLAYGASRNQILKTTNDIDLKGNLKRAVIISELDCE